MKSSVPLCSTLSPSILSATAYTALSWKLAGQYPQTDPLPSVATLPRLFPPARFHLGILLALVTALLVWVFLFRTKAGFRLRATGANPTAAHFAGIAVEREVALAFLLSGALAGLAGGIEVSGVTQRVYEKIFSWLRLYRDCRCPRRSTFSRRSCACCPIFWRLRCWGKRRAKNVGVSSVLVIRHPSHRRALSCRL